MNGRFESKYEAMTHPRSLWLIEVPSASSCNQPNAREFFRENSSASPGDPQHTDEGKLHMITTFRKHNKINQIVRVAKAQLIQCKAVSNRLGRFFVHGKLTLLECD